VRFCAHTEDQSRRRRKQRDREVDPDEWQTYESGLFTTGEIVAQAKQKPGMKSSRRTGDRPLGTDQYRKQRTREEKLRSATTCKPDFFIEI
jgi:hypothetical protein